MDPASHDTITFLFTDIEKSTEKWERVPDQMQVALKRHDAILTEAISNNHGRVFKTVGDAFCAAFSDAGDALLAAVAAQRVLHAEVWDSELGEIRVRMALHSGTAEERDGDYFGPTLNRIARLLSTAHGGQTVLSLVAAELVRDQLPPGTTLIEMGEHRLKDLYRPETISQLAIHGLFLDFPPLAVLDSATTNLPMTATPFIGREQELEAVLETVRQPASRLVNLIGPGGTGKTRLALQAAADLLDDFEDGVYFVDLSPIVDARLVTQSIARTLELAAREGATYLELLKAYLKDKRMLLVLDNFEQVVEAAADVDALLKSTSELKIVVTSRDRLQLYGERDFPVSPLRLPERGSPVGSLSQYEAVALFIERASSVLPTFRMTEENAPAVAEICVRLDGLPLAIELAAARVRLLSPSELLKRLDEGLKVLSGGARNLPARQRTIQAAIDWSYALLSPEEQRLLSRLAVFAGGWTLDAAEHICAGANTEDFPPLGIDLFEGTESLFDKSLIRRSEGSTETRFGMLLVVREYAAERLSESGEADAVRNAHLAYFGETAGEGKSLPDNSPKWLTWMNKMNSEVDNLRAAADHAIAVRDGESFVQLYFSFFDHPYFQPIDPEEWYRWLEPLSADPSGLSQLVQGLTQGALGNTVFEFRDYRSALAAFEQSVNILRKLENAPRLSQILAIMSATFLELDDTSKATETAQEGLSLGRERNDARGQVWNLIALGEVARTVNDEREARRWYEEGIEIAEISGFPQEESVILSNLAQMALMENNSELARPISVRALKLKYVQSSPGLVSTFLEVIARTLEKAVDGVMLLGAAETLSRIGRVKRQRPDQTTFEATVELLHSRIDPDSFEKAMAAGRKMTLDEAVHLALRDAEVSPGDQHK